MPLPLTLLLVVVILFAFLSAIRGYFDTIDRSKSNNTFPFLVLICALVVCGFSLELWRQDSQTRTHLSVGIAEKFDKYAASIDNKLSEYLESRVIFNQDLILAQEEQLKALNLSVKLLEQQINAISVSSREGENLQKSEAELLTEKIEAQYQALAQAEMIRKSESELLTGKIDNQSVVLAKVEDLQKEEAKLLVQKINTLSIAFEEADKLQRKEAKLLDSKFSQIEKLINSHLSASVRKSVDIAQLDGLLDFIAKNDVWNQPRDDFRESDTLIKYSGEDYYLKHLFDTTAFITKEPGKECLCKEKSCIDLSFLHGLEVEKAKTWIAQSREINDLISLVLVGRHDVRSYPSNSDLAQDRAICIGALFNFSDIPIRYASGVNRNNLRQLSEGELAEDRQVEVYVIFQKDHNHNLSVSKESK